MSVIDKKGKLFGKLNIIDLLAILLIVAVLALITISFYVIGNAFADAVLHARITNRHPLSNKWRTACSVN